MATHMPVYLEVGKTRVFAVALDWPGFCRVGRNEDAALGSLLEYAPRYAHVVQRSQLGFHTPETVGAFEIVERVDGDSTTDFGAPSIILERDRTPASSDDVHRWELILNACWRALDAAAEEATGKTLKKGPRGGGRELEKILEHVRDVDLSYLRNLGGSLEKGSAKDMPTARTAILHALHASIKGELPTHGPRGGERWPARYFVRRLGWHELDHVWEIENRAEA